MKNRTKSENNLFFEINNNNELVIHSDEVNTRERQNSIHVLRSLEKPVTESILFSERKIDNIVNRGSDCNVRNDFLAQSYNSTGVQQHEHEIRGEQLKLGEYFFVSWTSSISPYQFIGTTGGKTGSDYLIGKCGTYDERTFLKKDEIVRLEKVNFNIVKPPLEMTNSEALQAVFHFIIENTFGLKEAITSAGKVKAIGILKNAVKRGYGAFTDGLLFAVRQENGPDKNVELFIGKQGNHFPFKITNYRDLLGRYFYGDDSVPDVAPPGERKSID
ncbi:hypothetical protein [Paenibacillus agricola]|uniref:RES domain-containing protein n=1 Tax=Paenibacillus agricola TaxID=2716264 RepID=A0ABX0JE47_9BACL|nr:hypothetical protein [Paenibacillus agricola]NHN33147.1 hypothetical protein [Paenibacillus agricola]